MFVDEYYIHDIRITMSSMRTIQLNVQGNVLWCWMGGSVINMRLNILSLVLICCLDFFLFIDSQVVAHLLRPALVHHHLSRPAYYSAAQASPHSPCLPTRDLLLYHYRMA